MIEAKETVVGSLDSTSTLKGTTNTASTYTSEYILPKATKTTLGGIIVGDNLNIKENGILDAVVPTNTSDLNNDSGFLTEIPEEYITEEELASKGYVNKDEIPTAPTKTSELENDSGFISSIPSEYVTEEELNAKGYLTEHQDISNLATKDDLTNLATKDELHSHSNKEVLDSISQENLDSWNAELTEPDIYSGTEEPDATLGKDGDIYIKYS